MNPLGCDVLEMPAAAGWEVLGQTPCGGPVALAGGRTRFLIAPGAAAELPGLLDWLEWGALPLDLTACPAGSCRWAGAEWLRPPGPGSAAELPAVCLPGCPGADLVRLVSAAAAACHRVRLLSPSGRSSRADRPDDSVVQPFVFS
jgi:hypothetical protein